MPTKEDYEYVKELKEQIESMNSCHQGTVAELVGMTYDRDRLRAPNEEMLGIVEAVGEMLRTSKAMGKLWNAVDWNTDLGDKDPALAAYNAAGEAHTAAWDKMEALYKAWTIAKAEAQTSSNVKHVCGDPSSSCDTSCEENAARGREIMNRPTAEDALRAVRDLGGAVVKKGRRPDEPIMVCTVCGIEEVVRCPLPVDQFCAIVYGFDKRHLACQAKKNDKEKA